MHTQLAEVNIHLNHYRTSTAGYRLPGHLLLVILVTFFDGRDGTKGNDRYERR